MCRPTAAAAERGRGDRERRLGEFEARGFGKQEAYPGSTGSMTSAATAAGGGGEGGGERTGVGERSTGWEEKMQYCSSLFPDLFWCKCCDFMG